jgi:hypothetical protein
MNLTYEVQSSEEGKSLIKFFYQEEGRYGEFFIELERLSKNMNNSESPLGVYGNAVLQAKDIDYAFPLLKGFAEALEFVKICESCGKKYNASNHIGQCDKCFEETQNDHMGDIEE